MVECSFLEGGIFWFTRYFVKFLRHCFFTRSFCMRWTTFTACWAKQTKKNSSGNLLTTTANDLCTQTSSSIALRSCIFHTYKTYSTTEQLPSHSYNAMSYTTCDTNSKLSGTTPFISIVPTTTAHLFIVNTAAFCVVWPAT